MRYVALSGRIWQRRNAKSCHPLDVPFTTRSCPSTVRHPKQFHCSVRRRRTKRRPLGLSAPVLGTNIRRIAKQRPPTPATYAGCYTCTLSIPATSAGTEQRDKHASAKVTSRESLLTTIDTEKKKTKNEWNQTNCVHENTTLTIIT